MSPKSRALVGQASTHAGLRSRSGNAWLYIRVLADLESLHAIEECSGRILAVRVVIGKRSHFPRSVPFLATRNAGMAADADVEVDDQCELGHFQSPFPATNASQLGRSRA